MITPESPTVPPGSEYAIGIDVGGTNTKAVVLQKDSVVMRQTTATVRGEPADTIAGVCYIAADLVARFSAVDRVGVTLPGHFDDDGAAVVVPNLPGDWPGTAVRQPLESAAGRPVTLVNDARAFGLAEARLGAARGAHTAVGVVLGTGIGGVVLFDGRLHLGSAAHAGELGHQVLDPNGPLCGCGNRGCLESLARADVVAAAAGQPTMHDVVRTAASGNTASQQALEQAARWIGHGLANVATVLQPDVVFLGGGVAEAGDALLTPIRDNIRRLSPLVPPESYRVVLGALGAWAGAIGAALAAGRLAG